MMEIQTEKQGGRKIHLKQYPGPVTAQLWFLFSKIDEIVDYLTQSISVWPYGTQPPHTRSVKSL